MTGPLGEQQQQNMGIKNMGVHSIRPAEAVVTEHEVNVGGSTVPGVRDLFTITISM